MFCNWRFVALVSASALVACDDPTARRDDWPTVPTTVIQFCIASSRPIDSYTYSTAILYSNGKPSSLGGSTAYPVGFTRTGQQVFEGYGAIPPQVLRAILGVKDDGYTPVYYPPASSSKDQWTAWTIADFESDDYELIFKVQQRGVPEVNKRPPSTDAPKVRFRQKTYVDFRNALENYQRGNIVRDMPAC